MEIILSDNDSFQKALILTKWTSDSGKVSHWVNLRTFWLKEEERIPTKNGVMLRTTEFWKLLKPLFERKEWTQNCSKNEETTDATDNLADKETRGIRLRKNEKYSFMMEIMVTTPKGESTVSLTIGEIGKIVSNKRLIYNYFKEN